MTACTPCTWQNSRAPSPRPYPEAHHHGLPGDHQGELQVRALYQTYLGPHRNPETRCANLYSLDSAVHVGLWAVTQHHPGPCIPSPLLVLHYLLSSVNTCVLYPVLVYLVTPWHCNRSSKRTDIFHFVHRCLSVP